MNTTQIAALYTRHPDVARLLDSWAPGADQALLALLRLARKDDTPHEIRIKHFAPEGISLQQTCPWRVFDWACAQFPADDQPQPKGESWSAMAADFTTEKGGALIRYGSATDFATLLRGLRHYQRKLNRGAKKQLAQLRAYHQQQLDAQFLTTTAATAAALTTLANGRKLSCLHLPIAEYYRRTDLAEELEEQKRVQYDRPDGRYGREIMWHPSFPSEFVATLSNMPLYEVAAFLSSNPAKDFNAGRPLDFADYCYLADLLREGLASQPAPLAALRLERALALVKQAGAALRLVAAPMAAITSAAAA